MSESEHLNESFREGELPDDALPRDALSRELESLLTSLSPQPLHVSRDELFFRAGQASISAAAAGRWIPSVFWPAVAAALMIACGGLIIELAQQRHQLQAALAASSRAVPSMAATDSAKPLHGGLATSSDNAQDILTRRLDDWENLAAGRPLALGKSLASGQLTARGWRMQRTEVERSSDVSPATVEPVLQPRGATYMELLNAQREG